MGPPRFLIPLFTHATALDDPGRPDRSVSTVGGAAGRNLIDASPNGGDTLADTDGHIDEIVMKARCQDALLCGLLACAARARMNTWRAHSDGSVSGDSPPP